MTYDVRRIPLKGLVCPVSHLYVLSRRNDDGQRSAELMCDVSEEICACTLYFLHHLLILGTEVDDIDKKCYRYQ